MSGVPFMLICCKIAQNAGCLEEKDFYRFSTLITCCFFQHSNHNYKTCLEKPNECSINDYGVATLLILILFITVIKIKSLKFIV